MINWYDSIPTPVDSNGNVVPLDTKKLVHKGNTREVYIFVYNIRLKDWFVKFMKGEGIRLGACTMPDSWERLEEDAQKDICGYFGHVFVSNGQGLCDDCRAKSGVCSKTMARDLVRRAKKLAGVVDDD